VIGVLGQGPTTTTTTPSNPASGLVESLTNLDEACGDDPSWACRQVLDRTGNDTLAGVTDWFVARPFTILVIVVAAVVVSRLLRWLIKRSTQRMLDPKNQERHRRLRARTPVALQRPSESWSLRTEARAHTLTAVLQSVATVAVWFVAVVWILGVVDIDFGPLIAGAGIAGVALGFGAQNMVRDFLAGFFMVVEDQLGVGDIVDLDPDVQGTVERVTLRATRVRAVDGTVWHVPNGQILRVGNMSQEWARALLDVEVPYGTDVAEAERVIGETAVAVQADPLWGAEILEAPEVWGVENLGPNGVTIRLVVKTKPAAQYGVMRELRARLLTALSADGIEIPFPQLTIHRTAAAEPGPDPEPEPGGEAPEPPPRP
jgi:small-conductance mechanosensitive channel